MGMRFRLLAGILVVCFSFSVNAQQTNYQNPSVGYGYAMQQRTSNVEEAGVILKAGLDKLMGFFNSTNTPSAEQISLFLGKEIAPYFDFGYMAKWTAGVHYSRMSPIQKRKLESLMRTQFLTSMAQKLTAFKQQNVKYLVPRQTGKNQVILSIALANQGVYPARLDFRLYKSNQGWKVFDVSANGSSALMYYRQYFLRNMKRKMMYSGYQR